MPVRISDSVPGNRLKPAKKEASVLVPGAIVIELSNARADRRYGGPGE